MPTTDDLMHGRGVCALDVPPQRTLGARPRVYTADDHDLAAAWLAWIVSRVDTVARRCEQQLALVKLEAQNDLHVTIEGERLRLDDYAARLVDAIEEAELRAAS